MFFEQKLIGDDDYFHQDKNGWADRYAAHLNEIANDFQSDLAKRDHQRYFGDWVQYNGHSDVGYYLGAKFARWLHARYPFDEMNCFDIQTVQAQWRSYLNQTRHDVLSQ